MHTTDREGLTRYATVHRPIREHASFAVWCRTVPPLSYQKAVPPTNLLEASAAKL